MLRGKLCFHERPTELIIVNLVGLIESETWHSSSAAEKGLKGLVANLCQTLLNS